MADRNSAEIFGRLFDYLAFYIGTVDRKEFAKYLWTISEEYDFSPGQMECDEALLKLGLARKVKTDKTTSGEIIDYGPGEG